MFSRRILRLTVNWTTWWPDAAKRTAVVHTLGKPGTLESKPELGRKELGLRYQETKNFAGKTGTSPFAMTTEVLAVKEWTLAVYEERQARFLKKLSDTWRLA